VKRDDSVQSSVEARLGREVKFSPTGRENQDASEWRGQPGGSKEHNSGSSVAGRTVETAVIRFEQTAGIWSSTPGCGTGCKQRLEGAELWRSRAVSASILAPRHAGRVQKSDSGKVARRRRS